MIHTDIIVRQTNTVSTGNNCNSSTFDAIEVGGGHSSSVTTGDNGCGTVDQNDSSGITAAIAFIGIIGNIVHIGISGTTNITEHIGRTLATVDRGTHADHP